MLNKNLAAFGIPALVLGFFGLGSFFIVNEVEQVLILQFGEIVRVIREPGLHMKIPFVQDVLYWDKRILDFDVPTTEVTLGDQKRIVVDTFTRYRIHDLARFYKTVRNETGAKGRLSALITGTLRSILAETSLHTLLSPQRTALLKEIRGKVNTATQSLGIEVVDVRIRRADLPPENSQAIYNRMISERQKEAQKIRAEGNEKAQFIRAEADLECATIMANATQESQIEMGTGDQEALRIVSEAYRKSPDFAAFFQSMDAYKTALGAETQYVLSPKKGFLRHFQEGTP